MSTRQNGQVWKADDGTWAIRWRNPPGRVPARPQLGGFPTKGEARKVLEEKLRQIRLGAAYRPELTLAQACDAYLAQYQCAKTTRAWFERHINIAKAEFGTVPIAELDSQQIAAWRMTLPKSGHQTLRVLRQVLAQSVAWGWAEADPTASIKNTVAPPKEILPFASWEEIEAICAELHERDARIVRVAAGTGLRPQELFGLEWRDVDLDEGILVVRRAYTLGELKEPKTKASRRRVPLRARVVAEFDSFPSIRSGVVFTAAKGGRVDLGNWREDYWKPALVGAGLKHRGPYALRHTYATWALAAGVNVLALARRMGTSVMMIERTYGHLMPNADDHERGLMDVWDAGQEPGDVVELQEAAS